MFKNLIKFFTIKEVYKTLLTIGVICIIYLLINKLLNKIVIKGKNDYDIKRRKTIVTIFQNIIKYIFAIILLLIVLQIFGINTKSFIAGLGIAGVVVGLALQDALKDIISGISIIMDDYYVVGDTVEIKGYKGTVVSMGLKATSIQSANGAINILPNRNIDNVINYSKKSPKLTLKISLNNNNKKDTVEKYLKNIINEMIDEELIRKTSKYLGIDEITSTLATFTIELDCNRNTEKEVKRIFNSKIKELFDNNKLEK